jgi:phage terminase large subunit
MRDFFEILQKNKLYNDLNHNKSKSEYYHKGNLIEFISLDQPQKVRGRKRNLLYINEANELFFEDWQQLILRTTEKAILDYNPSDEFHFIYDKIKTRDDADFYITTYKDNPFLEVESIKEIERLKEIDLNYWNVYGLGQTGSSQALTFKINIENEIPNDAKLLAFGLDFGFTNSPTSLVAVYLKGDDLYFEELLYQTNLTNLDISNKFSELGFDRRTEIFADDSEPKSIEELYRLGWNVKRANKKEVNIGIDMMKRYKLNVKSSSINMIKEFRNYKWVEDKNGNVLNTPVKMFDHTIDAIRYALFNKLSRPNFGKYAIR